MFRCSVLVSILAAGAACGQEAPAELPDGFDPPAFAETLPGSVLRQMRQSPGRFVGEAADLILGFGAAGGIDTGGIDRAIAFRRAAARAEAARRLLQADADDDGMVSQDELLAFVAVSEAGGRGPVLLAHRAADTDGDGAASPDEIRTAARNAATAEVNEEEALELRSLLAFDLDRDGRATLPEIMAVLDAVRADAQM